MLDCEAEGKHCEIVKIRLVGLVHSSQVNYKSLNMFVKNNPRLYLTHFPVGIANES